MATKRVQMKITVDREMNDVLQRLADAMNKKRATIVSDLLEESRSSLERLAVVLEAARVAPEITRKKIAQSLEATADEVKETMGDMLNQIDAFDEERKRVANK